MWVVVVVGCWMLDVGCWLDDGQGRLELIGVDGQLTTQRLIPLAHSGYVTAVGADITAKPRGRSSAFYTSRKISVFGQDPKETASTGRNQNGQR